jgi:O-antigen ligase
MAVLERLQGPGIFNDPNDFSLILVTGILFGLDRTFDKRNGKRRVFWLAPIGLLGYALMLTHSRGGLLSLLAGGAVLLVSRFGWKRFMLAAVVMLPVVGYVFGGRQTSINLDDNEDTALGRVQLWKECLVIFHQWPIFGVGCGNLADEAGLVAHSSYIHAFAELGAVGGTLFVGAVYFPMMIIRKSRKYKYLVSPQGSDVLAWRPCMLAILAGYATGMFSLSRPYAFPTYLMLGIAGAYCNLLVGRFPDSVPRVTMSLAIKLVKVSLACIIFLHIFVIALAR